MSHFDLRGWLIEIWKTEIVLCNMVKCDDYIVNVQKFRQICMSVNGKILKSVLRSYQRSSSSCFQKFIISIKCCLICGYIMIMKGEWKHIATNFLQNLLFENWWWKVFLNALWLIYLRDCMCLILFHILMLL